MLSLIKTLNETETIYPGTELRMIFESGLILTSYSQGLLNIEQTIILTRCRKDLSLCFPATDSPRQVYDRRNLHPNPSGKITLLNGKQKNISWEKMAASEI